MESIILQLQSNDSNSKLVAIENLLFKIKNSNWQPTELQVYSIY